MFLFPAAALIGLGIGYLRGGRFSTFTSPGVRHVWLVLVAVVLQVGQGHGPFRAFGSDFHRGVVLVSYGVIGVWLAVNARDRPPVLRRAIGLVALGWFLNLTAILPNGGMPVSQSALEQVGEGRAAVTQTQLWKHVRATPDTTTLYWLGDVLPVPGPMGIRSVVSVGDLVMLGGFALAASAAMTTPELRAAV
jgi:Family of unknown function (DUF5317)